jgi:hypothetical protein
MYSEFTLPEAEDDSDRKLLSDIEKYGWHVVFVTEEPATPQFAFTVGLHYRYSHPEILVMGLKQATAHSLLHSLVEKIKQGEKLESGSLVTDIASFPLALVPIHIDHYREHLGYGMWFYRSLRAPFPALQLVWPDRAGLFPWQNGYDARFNELQRMLHRAS